MPVYSKELSLFSWKILPVEDSVDSEQENGSHEIYHKKDSRILDTHLQHKSAI